MSREAAGGEFSVHENVGVHPLNYPAMEPEVARGHVFSGFSAKTYAICSDSAGTPFAPPAVTSPCHDFPIPPSWGSLDPVKLVGARALATLQTRSMCSGPKPSRHRSPAQQAAPVGRCEKRRPKRVRWLGTKSQRAGEVRKAWPQTVASQRLAVSGYWCLSR